MYFSTKRQQFLIQQGYAFKVVTDLIGEGDKVQLKYSTKETQVELLGKVLRLGEGEAGEEVLPEDADALVKTGAARRTKGSMLALSGARGAYLEYSTGGGSQRAGGSQRPAAPRPVKPRNAILRERDAARRGK